MERPGRGLFVVLMLLVPMILPLPAVAQTGEARDERQLSRQEMQHRIVQQFERRMARELRLDASQVEQVQEVMSSMLDERRELFQRRRALRARIQRFDEEGGSERMARGILSESRAIRAEEARIEAEEEARLLEVLSPAQVLRFKIMRDELSDRIRRMQRGEPDTARRPGPGRDGRTGGGSASGSPEG